ncbi:enoyl-CoA hydratase-related protein [Sphaerobacter sp.]|uniref:enoyl-CoA hydratase-related protein n=1 Tax=Sphaerobacter sp. TaxID=2099654 RepID=UPI001E135F54|nr:enoyl-CoA hydratase-related protein [Sphaerobacter sp.]MBX5444798.1 enoyl-CoA hydratase/isomerase family protein [Sphaerobacter sp.]
MGATYETLIVEKLDGRVGLIRLNRPERLNALNQTLMRELVQAVAAFDQDDEVGAIVLTGNEAAFAAGADVTEMDGAGVADMLSGYRFDEWEQLRRTRKPMIAAVSGWALGGGCELAMLCDMIVASETARFGQPEINLGIMPGAGGTQRLTRQIGKYLAMEMVLAGRQLTAAEAERFGLVNRVVPVEAYLDAALELARIVAAKAPLAVQLAKEAILRGQDVPLEAGLAHERHNFYLLFGTADKQEGIRAFLEKRRAEWQGR